MNKQLFVMIILVFEVHVYRKEEAAGFSRLLDLPSRRKSGSKLR